VLLNTEAGRTLLQKPFLYFVLKTKQEGNADPALKPDFSPNFSTQINVSL